MDLFPLPLFPEGSLRESVVTTVWVGVFVISFFNLRFGWTYSGLVIPGYLVPLILTNPMSACVTMVEGVLAYGLVRLFSDYLSRFGWWCSFFGRDRFFALLLSAVLVRVCMDGWGLPLLGAWLQERWNLTFDYPGAFHSFGLIIIALIANQFWKTGFWRGLVPFFTTLGITFVLIRFVLMTVTNFNIGHMAYLYSSTAASLLASPKSYIILIVTGFVASRMNLRYGWEYNGILIPALLALQWYEPLKILSSLVEAAVVYIVSDRLLQTRWFRGTTMEGARKLLLFFNVAYAYRFLLGHLLPLISPDLVVNDYYGFAYLLSSLIALKMHSKQIVLRLSRATIQTSFGAAVAANLIGFWLASVFGSVSMSTPRIADGPVTLQTSADSLGVLAVKEKLRLYSKRSPESVSMPTPGQLNRFEEALRLIRRHVETGASGPLNLAQRHLQDLEYTVERVNSTHLCLREQAPARGWGIYFIDLEHPIGLLLEVPAPLEEWSVMDSAVMLYDHLDASGLAIAGSGRFVNRDGSSDVLANGSTPFDVFHRVFGRRNVLQVRGSTTGRRSQPSTGRNTLFVKKELPRSLSLSALKGALGSVDVRWKPDRSTNVQRRKTRAGFAELWLNRSTRTRLKATLAESELGSNSAAAAQEGLLFEWILQQKNLMAGSGTDDYRPPTLEEISFVDDEILTPLLETARAGYVAGELSADAWQSIQAINWSGSLVGYEVRFLHDISCDWDFLVLAESSQSVPRRHWGALVVRLGATQPYAIQVPRPLFDLNCLEYGLHLFERLEAQSLLFAGSHNEANRNQTADALDFRNAVNFFSLGNQTVMRQARGRQMMVVQCRGVSTPPGAVREPEILIAFPDGIRSERLLTPLGRTLYDTLATTESRVQFVDGSPLTAGYEISSVPQAQYVTEAARQEFAIVWLSPALRRAFRPQDQDYALRAQLKALEVPIQREDVASWLEERLPSNRKTRLPAELKDVLDHYSTTLDIVTLRRALNEWPGFSFVALEDRTSGQLMLSLSEDRSALPVLLNLQPRPTSPELPNLEDQQRIDVFMASRSRWLEWSL